MGPRGPEETMMSQPEVASLYGGPATRRVRTRDLLAAKERGEKWAMLTSYDQYTAGIFDGAGIPVLLVGDSAANNVYGYETTLQVTVDELLPLVKAVVRATRRTLVVGDMPFGSYEEGPAQALRTACRAAATLPTRSSPTRTRSARPAPSRWCWRWSRARWPSRSPTTSRFPRSASERAPTPTRRCSSGRTWPACTPARARASSSGTPISPAP